MARSKLQSSAVIVMGARWHGQGGMGVDRGRTGEQRENLELGTLMQIVPLSRSCHIGTKRSILWPSKYVKIRFRSRLDPLVG